MLACAKIGADPFGGLWWVLGRGAAWPHRVSSHSKLAITADGGWLNGKIVEAERHFG